MKTLYSCGCSFMSIDTKDTGITSFLDMYCEEKGFRHVSLARSGATNFLIRLQIEEAIKQKADYIVVGTTTSDRIDIPIPDKQINYPVTVHDVDYSGYRSASKNNVNNTEPTVISDSINNWTTDNYTWVFHDNYKRKEITPEIINAMKHYVAYLHNFQLQQMQDYFIISDALRKMMALNKEFVFLRGPMYCDWSFVGNRLWTKPQPWDVPYGIDPTPVNHSSQQAHNDFARVLAEMTAHWCN